MGTSSDGCICLGVMYDEDHEFTSDPYTQNCLLRLHINEAIIAGIDQIGRAHV